MLLNILLEKRNSSPSIRLLSHVLFWVAVCASSYFFIKTSYSAYRHTPLSYLVPLRDTMGLIIVFYPLMYVLIPQILKRKEWYIFAFYSTLLLFVYVFFEALGEKMTFYFCKSCQRIAMENNPDHLSVIQKGVLDNLLYKASNVGLYFNLLSSLILPIAIKTSLGYYNFYIKNIQLEKENVQLELNFLKAQVNPHFLFNTLNNLYGLIIHNRTEASKDTVTRLADFMRYSLDNADKKSVLLSEEIELIKNYIELEKLRLNYTRVLFTTNGTARDKSLPPLLFIPLLENAFKYNEDKQDTEICVDLQVRDNDLYFKVYNTFGERKVSGITKSGGLGLSNLKKRLDLNFSNDHVYNVNIENSIYIATLKLALK